MIIRNYDDSIKKAHKRRCDFIDADVRMCIVGRSGDGKTNFLMHIFINVAYFDKVIIYAKFISQEKSEYLTKMDEISRKIGYTILELKSPCQICDSN